MTYFFKLTSSVSRVFSGIFKNNLVNTERAIKKRYLRSIVSLNTSFNYKSKKSIWLSFLFLLGAFMQTKANPLKPEKGILESNILTQRGVNGLTQTAGYNYIVKNETNTKLKLSETPKSFVLDEIRGKVTDATTGAPLVGVTIKVKGSSVGTVTDSQGNFTIDVPGDAVLMVSYIGYTSSQLPVNGRSAINIRLEASSTALNQLVVVGYGVQKKVDLTGSVAVVDQKMLENRPVSNAIQALQGTAPGLIVTRTDGQPGQEGWNINIRGFFSLNGTNSPLIIVDGVPGSLSDINPDDIASISVLKDAAAASIYGAKASGGVILVTTKMGKKDKLTVNYTGLYTIKQIYNLPQRIPSYEEAEMANLANENAGLPGGWTSRQIGFMKGTDSNFIYNNPVPSLNGFYFNLNQTPYIIRSSSPSWTHDISVSGGNGKYQKTQMKKQFVYFL